MDKKTNQKIKNIKENLKYISVAIGLCICVFLYSVVSQNLIKNNPIAYLVLTK